MSYGKNDTGHRGMSDDALRDERTAQEIVRGVLYLSKTSLPPRQHLIERLREAQRHTSLRNDQLGRFIAALQDDECAPFVGEIADDYSPDFVGWDEDIKEATQS